VSAASKAHRRSLSRLSLDGAAYRLDATLQGTTAGPLPPFLDLPLDPAAIWR
jgi:hypothetical protein